ncbi:MAG: hypothetical protein O2800_07440 [Planctomycetota bacterium]|nr:hypothetical protein [Planctomycetota bacterium]
MIIRLFSFALLFMMNVLSSTALGDGGLLVLRGDLNGSPVVVYVSPVSPTVGTMRIEVVGQHVRSRPPIIHLRGADYAIDLQTTISLRDSVAVEASFWIPTAANWTIEVEGMVIPPAVLAVGPEPSPWTARWPWMVLWVPVLLLALVRPSVVKTATR